MHNLIDTARSVTQNNRHLPFSVYSSIEEQTLFNVPLFKPLLIFVLSGSKELGQNSEISCPAGSFVFLSNHPNIDMRNIPNNEEYFAVIIEFEYEDFDCLEPSRSAGDKYFVGETNAILEQTLLQFIEWSNFAPSDLWPMRRQEMLRLLFSLGYKQVSAIMESPSLTHKVHNIISANVASEPDVQTLSSMLAMSESTLRRKLTSEGSSLQAIKDSAKLGHGLHLVQTTLDSIGMIAEQCGYQSQSRFTDKFKQLFGVTPTALRKTIMHG